ncbi:MAG: hypothetical protein AB7Q00_15140 [Phycisphaerales bacterium]
MNTLPTDSDERKEIPLFSGPFSYFPAALAGVARVCKAGNDKHNPGEPLHWARGKSTDEADCVLRHMMDVNDMVARSNREGFVDGDMILAEASAACWRVLAWSQKLHEQFGAPLAPGARLPEEEDGVLTIRVKQNVTPFVFPAHALDCPCQWCRKNRGDAEDHY